MAAETCGVAQGLLSLVDADRQWFKASFGPLDVRSTPREQAFCAHAIAGSATFEIPDATSDARFSGNPLVTGDPGIRFYAGVPLQLGSGSPVGTLCVIDFQPRQLSAEQRHTLGILADLAAEALQMRQRLIERSVQASEQHVRELAFSRARFQALVEQQGELVSLARPNGDLVYVNAAYARHHGLSVAELLGSNLFDKIPADERGTVRRRIDDVMNTGRRVQVDNRVVGADGRERWIGWTNSIQADEQGRPLLHSVGRDITDRVQAEAALRERESFLDRTGRAAGVGGWQLAVQTGELTWSAQTRRIHEVPEAYRPTLQAAIEFYAPEARPEIEAAVATSMRNGTPWDLELPFVTATGRPIWVRAVGEVEFERGEPVRLVGAFQDITERRQLQERVQASERFLRKITDSLPLRVAYTDAELRYRFVNEAQCRRLGLPRDAVLGRTQRELMGVGGALVDPCMQPALQGTLQRFEVDDVVDGSQRRIESQLIPDIDAAGRVLGVYTTAVDITERSQAEQSLRELTAIVDSTDDLVVQTDRHGGISYLNSAARRALGMEAEAPLAGLNFASFNTDETNRLFADTILPAVRERGCWVGDTTVRVAGGRVLPVSHLVIAHRDAQGRVARFSAVMRDESAKVEARRQLLLQTATLRSVAESIPACVAVVGADQRYRFVNTAFERWIGSAREGIIGRRVQDVLGRSDYERVRPAIEQALRGEPVNCERHYEVQGRQLNFAVSYVPLWTDEGTVDGFVGVLQDISDHRRKEVQLTSLTERDGLTGLYNRVGFERHLEEAVSGGTESGLALLYLDLDHFKPVNDTHGHPVGDKLLRQFAVRLTGLVRPTDFIARMGGDEFVVLLHGVREAANAQAVAKKIVAAAKQPFVIDGISLHIGVSVGVACGGANGTPSGSLVERADAALYAAKRTGRGAQALAA